MKEAENPIVEAERYLQNARTLLSEKAGKEGNYYTDRKYVRMAGHTAWCGILIALEAVLDVKEDLKRGQQIEFNDYKNAIRKMDRKMPRLLVNSYDTLHKAIGYDGNLNYTIVQSGLKEAQKIIDWAGKHYHPN